MLALSLIACKGKEAETVSEPAPVVAEEAYFNPDALIEPDELMAMTGEAQLKIIDFREREAYEKGHIPGSIRLWRSDIEDPTQPIPGMIAPKETMEALFSGLGIESGDALILYDDHAGVNAARLWWVLQVYGHQNVRLLNGGLQGWEHLEGPSSREDKSFPPSNFRFQGKEAPSLRIERDSLLAHLDRSDWNVVDVRTRDEYSGKRMKAGAKAAGHIPGSVHIDWADAVHYNGDHKFRPFKDLKRVYRQLPEDRNSTIITYCHSGVRSAHTTFVLTQLLGYRQVHNYDGSWLEWSSIEGAPIETDSLTTIMQ